MQPPSYSYPSPTSRSPPPVDVNNLLKVVPYRSTPSSLYVDSLSYLLPCHLSESLVFRLTGTSLPSPRTPSLIYLPFQPFSRSFVCGRMGLFLTSTSHPIGTFASALHWKVHIPNPTSYLPTPCDIYLPHLI